MTVESVMEIMRVYWVHAMFMFIVLYATWHVGHSRYVINRHYRKNGFERMTSPEIDSRIMLRDGSIDSILLSPLVNWNKRSAAPHRAWTREVSAGNAGKTPDAGTRFTSQFTARRKRQSMIWRKKNNNRAQYNATIVSLQEPRSHICIRPKMVLEAMDYLFDGKEINLQHDEEFSNYYHVFATVEEDALAVLDTPLRAMLMEVEGLSVEVIGQSLVLLRHHNYFDATDHLDIEMETGLALADFLDGRARAGLHAHTQSQSAQSA